METKVIIAGSRSFYDYDLLEEECDKILRGKDNIEVISGQAIGADLLGEIYAGENNYTVKHYPADWNKYGKRAGFIRNMYMAEHANLLIAFWDGKSKGTKHMIKTAHKMGIKAHIIRIK